MRGVVSAFWVACLLCGCGYTFGTRLAGGPATLEVPIFGNTTLVRGLEFEITKGLVEELKSRTAVGIVAGGAHARLSGAITEYEKVPVHEAGGEVLAGRVRIAAAFELARSTGEVIRKGTVQEVQDFDVRAGCFEEDARRQAIREMARKMVYEIEEWRPRAGTSGRGAG